MENNIGSKNMTMQQSTYHIWTLCELVLAVSCSLQESTMNDEKNFCFLLELLITIDDSGFHNGLLLYAGIITYMQA